MAIGPYHIVEAQYPSGVRIRRFKYGDFEIVAQNLNAHEGNVVRIIAIDHVGRRYDWKKILYYALRKFIPWIKPMNSPKDELCSEVVEAIQKALGKNRGDISNLTPNELYRYFTND